MARAFSTPSMVSIWAKKTGRGMLSRAQSVIEGAHHAGQAAISARRIVHGTHAGLGFFHRGNHRDHDAGGSPVERACDEVGMRRADADDGGGVANGLELREHRRVGAAAVFEVDEQPVEAARIGEFGDDGGAGLQPGAELQVTLTEGGSVSSENRRLACWLRRLRLRAASCKDALRSGRCARGGLCGCR